MAIVEQRSQLFELKAERHKLRFLSKTSLCLLCKVEITFRNKLKNPECNRYTNRCVHEKHGECP